MNRRELLKSALVGALFAPPSQAYALRGTITVDGVADAWLASLALIEMAAVRARMLDPKSPGMHCKINEFVHERELVAAGNRAVTTPNNDTLYSNAFVDLTKGPVQLTVPDPGTRYQSVAVMDMFTNNNEVIGARTDGGAAGTYTLVAPGKPAPYSGRFVRAATPHAWVLGRTAVYHPDDLVGAHRLQDSLKLTGPAVDRYPEYATRDADWPAYFRSVDKLLTTDPAPNAAGLAMLGIMKLISPTFDRAEFGSDADIIDRGVENARAFLKSSNLLAGSRPRSIPSTPGDFGSDFRRRARVAVKGIGALPASEAKYMPIRGPNGTIFDDDRCYRLSLPGEMPVEGFWSITMYEVDSSGQSWLTSNPIGRYSIGDRTRGLKKTADGRIDILISRGNPGGENGSNWLPAPKSGPYRLTFRAYLPKSEMQDAKFSLPSAVAYQPAALR